MSSREALMLAMLALAEVAKGLDYQDKVECSQAIITLKGLRDSIQFTKPRNIY